MELNPLVIGCNCFRPLSGNYISQCYKASLRKSTHIHVSVPCRGTTFLNSNERLTVKSVSKFPSPVGELHFSMIFTEWQNSSSSKFPSPVGELHFSIISPHDCIRCAFYVSVPCRGTTFLNAIKTFINDNFGFPSPVGELHFSISIYGSWQNCPWKSFRPLSGNYISQYGADYFKFNETYGVSVPCRGTTFLNTIPAIPPPVWAHGRDCVGKIFLEK